MQVARLADKSHDSYQRNDRQEGSDDALPIRTEANIEIHVTAHAQTNRTQISPGHERHVFPGETLKVKPEITGVVSDRRIGYRAMCANPKKPADHWRCCEGQERGCVSGALPPEVDQRNR